MSKRRIPSRVRKLALRSAIVSALALALGFAPGGARAAHRPVVHPQRRLVAKRTAKRSARKPALRHVAYRYKKAALRRRRIWRRRRVWRRRVYLPAHPSFDRTRQIQAALGRAGYYKGDPNGRWDYKMADSLRNFQTANGLPPTGKLDALTLQKLGLGSNVAGVSAPKLIHLGAPAAPSTPAAAPSPKTPGI